MFKNGSLRFPTLKIKRVLCSTVIRVMEIMIQSKWVYTTLCILVKSYSVTFYNISTLYIVGFPFVSSKCFIISECKESCPHWDRSDWVGKINELRDQGFNLSNNTSAIYAQLWIVLSFTLLSLAVVPSTVWFPLFWYLPLFGLTGYCPWLQNGGHTK